jgi:hypothetical protein
MTVTGRQSKTTKQKCPEHYLRESGILRNYDEK